MESSSSIFSFYLTSILTSVVSLFVCASIRSVVCYFCWGNRVISVRVLLFFSIFFKCTAKSLYVQVPDFMFFPAFQT